MEKIISENIKKQLLEMIENGNPFPKNGDQKKTTGVDEGSG
jgi:hypothetical protein